MDAQAVNEGHLLIVVIFVTSATAERAFGQKTYPIFSS
jgi:hypothetical protein